MLVNLFIGHGDGDNTYMFLNNAFNIFQYKEHVIVGKNT